ncbi:MAG: hypothetical protein M0Q90_04780 [Bacteroidales bacterium]|nr:hypothetical protein [Bacteroidales bacterium]
MKKTIISFLLLFLAISIHLKSQPQWKFHVAFEDGIGAKDTIWFIWDTTATLYGLDAALGEEPVSLDYSVFNVWTYNGVNTTYDTLKTVALPYTDSFENSIDAINYELPITITWDSALLNADWLPPTPVGWINYARIDNNYFFFYNNNGLAHQYDMTLSDSVTAPYDGNTDPWAWQDWVHFPMGIYLVQDPTVFVDDYIYEPKTILSLYPNPFKINTSIEFYLENKSYVELSIFDFRGIKIRSLINQTLNVGNHRIKWNGLDQAGKPCKPAPYFVYLNVNGTPIHSIKLIKY